jgi:hypothetical protein
MIKIDTRHTEYSTIIRTPPCITPPLRLLEGVVAHKTARCAEIVAETGGKWHRKKKKSIACMRRSGLPMCQDDTLVISRPSCIELDALQPSCPVIAGLIIIVRAQALSSVVIDTLSWGFSHRWHENIAYR